MSILNRNKPDYLKEYIEDIIYDLAFNQRDFDIFYEYITYKGDTLYLNIPYHKKLGMEMLFLTAIITPDYNRFKEKGFNKLTISYNNPLYLSANVSIVEEVKPKIIKFEDGFIIESNNLLKFE